MKGKWVVITKIVLATWIWMVMKVNASDHNSNKLQHQLVSYPSLSLSVSEVTTSSYQQLIESIRSNLKGGEVHGIPVTRAPTQITDQNRYILIQLSYYEQSVTLAMKVSDAYIVAYSANNAAYFLKESDIAVAKKNLFTSAAKKVDLPYSGSYQDLEKKAGDRTKIDLGMGELGICVQNLYNYNQATVPKCLIVAIQMISEAARFPGITQAVSKTIGQTGDKSKFKPTSKMIDFETSWKKLSEKVQKSKDGTFDKITVGGVSFTNAQEVKKYLAIMLYVAPSLELSSPNLDLFTRQ